MHSNTCIYICFLCLLIVPILAHEIIISWPLTNMEGSLKRVEAVLMHKYILHRGKHIISEKKYNLHVIIIIFTQDLDDTNHHKRNTVNARGLWLTPGSHRVSRRRPLASFCVILPGMADHVSTSQRVLPVNDSYFQTGLLTLGRAC